MSKEPLYLKDSYLKTWKTTVRKANGKYIVLEDTAFFPNGGGQPWDEGVIRRESDKKGFRVVFTGKFSGDISHEVDSEGLKPGDDVECELDWKRRYMLMRAHTAAHVLSKIIYTETGAVISGNQLGVDKSRIDFTLEEFDKGKVSAWVGKANQMIRDGRDVKLEFIPREEAMNIPDFVRTLADLVQKIDVLRVINIDGFDQQACGGTHVRELREIGKISLLKAENKGRMNRRIYYSVG